MSWFDPTAFDKTAEKASRTLARLTSRRGVLSTLGKLIVGGAFLPLLPIDRTYGRTDPHQTDATKCDYWKYCAMDGQLCSCCGGTGTQCPPGTEASKVSWVGTCHNAQDSKNYLVSYMDCCGRSSCGQCYCSANVGERPGYEMAVHNDVNWCMANSQASYHCTVSVIVGVAD
jgi:methylamine dehydrogenase light chain